MNELVVATPLCDRCGREKSIESQGCPDCEARRVSVVLQPQVATIAQRGPVLIMPQYLQRRWVVLAILLCTGPIGLPLVWLSRRFSLLAKIGLTAGFVLLTVVLPIVLVWYWCDVAIHPLVEALGR